MSVRVHFKKFLVLTLYFLLLKTGLDGKESGTPSEDTSPGSRTSKRKPVPSKKKRAAIESDDDDDSGSEFDANDDADAATDDEFAPTASTRFGHRLFSFSLFSHACKMQRDTLRCQIFKTHNGESFNFCVKNFNTYKKLSILDAMTIVTVLGK